MAGFIQGQLMPKLSQEESDRTIASLDNMKDFEFSKDQISRIEIKKPGLMSSGHIMISPITGSLEKISLRHRIAFDRLAQLTQVFCPDKVKTS